MKKHLISITLIICLIAMVSQAASNSFTNSDSPSRSNISRTDGIQEMLFGVSTLKGIKEVNPWVDLEIASEDSTSPSQYDSLNKQNLKNMVAEILKKADIKTTDTLDITSADGPLSLHVIVFIKRTNDASPTYSTYIYTEAIQSITLSRDSSIQSFTRTWPMRPSGLYTRNMLVLNPQTLEQQVKDEISRQVGFFVSDFLKANPKPVIRNTEDVDIEALRKTLLEENTNTRYGLRIRDGDPRLEAIKQLDMAGSKEAVDVLLEFLTNNKMDRKLKQQALTALGQIGTESAIEAIKQFENWSQKRFIEPEPFHMGQHEYAIDHYSSYNVEPLAQTTDSKNTTWALVQLLRYGQYDPWLISMNQEKQWSRPIFVNLPDFLQIKNTSGISWKLFVEGDSVKIESDKIYEYKISDLLKDTDKDELPDIVEERLLTNPKNPDSDGDGTRDGQDSNPLTPKHKETNDTMEIRQAVFSVLFATTSSQGIVVIVDRDEFAKQEYYGFAGTVLRSPESREGFVNITSIDIRYQSDDGATVNISDWEASLAASVHEAKLKKINGKWIVVEFRMTRIS